MDTTLFEAWLSGRRLGDSTIREYVRTIRRVERIVTGQGWGLELTADQARWLTDHIPPSTIKNTRSALIHYWRFLNYDGPVDSILVPTETGLDVYKGLTEAEANRLEYQAERMDDGLPVLLGLYLGLRRSEIVALRHEDFNGQWVQIHGKGRRNRTLPLHPNLQLPEGSGWLFPGRNGHAHHSMVYKWVNLVAEAAGIGRIKPHALRHTCLTRLYRQTNNLRLVQRFAGHASSTTTERYTSVFSDELAAAVTLLDYRAA